MGEWWNIHQRGMSCGMKKSHKNGIAMNFENDVESTVSIAYFYVVKTFEAKSKPEVNVKKDTIMLRSENLYMSKAKHFQTIQSLAAT